MVFGRVLRLTAVAFVAIALAIAGYIGYQMVTSPGVRDARDWELLAALPNGRSETAAAVADGQLYVLGGLTGLGLEATDEATRYDPVADAWEALPDLPSARHHAAAAALDGTVFLSGGGAAGGQPQAALWALGSDAAQWVTLSPMPEPRFGHRMVAIGDRLYVVGGVGSGAAVLIYDVGDDRWSRGDAMPGVRDHLAALAVGNDVWTIGGRVDGVIQDRVDIYDPLADAWRVGPPLPQATSAASEGLLGTTIVISGGEDPGGTGGMVEAHWQLDTSAGEEATWQPLSPPPLTVHGAHGAVIGDRFLIAGGASRAGSDSRFAWSSLLQAYSPAQ